MLQEISSQNYEKLKILKAAKNQLARQDFSFFSRCCTPNYSESNFSKKLTAALQRFSDAVARKESPRLAIFAPPRHGKTRHVSELLPAFHLGHHPTQNVVSTSYGKDLAAMCTRKCRELVSMPFFREVFPDFSISADIARADEWETHRRGGYYGVGVGGGLTGRPADMLIIDDPVKSWADALSEAKRNSIWDWFASVAYTRLMPGGGVLIMHTRWHKDDLAGRILEKGGYEVLSFPAIDEEGHALDSGRYPIAALLDIKTTIGDTAWRALYQQEPSDTEGAILKRSQLRFAASRPESCDKACVSVDAAFKATDGSDNVSIQVWMESKKDFYCLHNDTRRIGFSDTVSAIDHCMQQYKNINPSLIIEDKANGPAIIDSLKRKYSRCIPVEPKGGKQARAMAIQPLFEARRVYLMQDAPWVDSMVNEIADFPTGKHDDQVDAMTQALNWLDGRHEPKLFDLYG